MRRHSAVWLAVAAALLPICVGFWTARETIQRLRDPCVKWGAPSYISLSVPPEGPCRGVEVTTQTRGQALTWFVLLQGGMLIAVVLGVLGAFLARPALIVAGASVMIWVALPTMWSFGWLFLVACGLLLLAARESEPAA